MMAADTYEPDDSKHAATIVLGKPAQARSIDPVGDVDWAQLLVSQLTQVTIQTDGIQGGDTQLNLYGPNSSSRLLQSDDDSGSGLYSRISTTLSPGWYWVKVNEKGNDAAILSYTLSASNGAGLLPDAYEPDDATKNAKSISVDGTVQQRTLNTIADVDWIKFTLTEPSEITIRADSESATTVLLDLYSAKGTKTGTFIQGGPASIVRNGLNSLDAGSYFVRVYTPLSPAAYTLRGSATAPISVVNTSGSARSVIHSQQHTWLLIDGMDRD